MDLVTLVLNEYLHVLKGVIDAKAALLVSLPSRDWSHAEKASSVDSGIDGPEPNSWPEADKWRALTAIATECQVKIHSEMRYVKREVTFSKLSGGDYSSIAKLLRNILIPISGLETAIQVNDRVEKRGGWNFINAPKDGSGSAQSDKSLSDEEKERWSYLFTQIDPAFKLLWQAMIEGLDYAFYTLQITKKPAFVTKEALEARAAEAGEEKSFAKYLQTAINKFLSEREAPLREWCRLSGLDDNEVSSKSLHQRRTSQLYLLLDVSL